MRYIFILISFIFFGCASDTSENLVVPEGMLTSDSMVPILAEMHMANAYVKLRAGIADSADARLNYLYRHIYATHQTTKDVFDQSLKFYSLHPDVLDSMYTAVISELSKKQAEEMKR
jgi:hypothetical protein